LDHRGAESNRGRARVCGLLERPPPTAGDHAWRLFIEVEKEDGAPATAETVRPDGKHPALIIAGSHQCAERIVHLRSQRNPLPRK
jgi:hypothetical protein